MLARQANAMAARLEAGLAGIPGARLRFPRGGNMLFAELPRPAHRRARAAGAQYYPWPPEQGEDGPEDVPIGVRLVTSWCSTEADIDGFLTALRGTGA